MKHHRTKSNDESGQIIVLAALMLAMVIAAAGFAVDIGMLARTRTTMQKNVDAMALAGAQDLCGTISCEPTALSSALEYGTKNGIIESDTMTIQFGVDCDGGTSDRHDMITVRSTRFQKSYLARVVGFYGGDVSACATAQKFAAGALVGVRPFGLEDNCVANISYGDIVILKHDADTTRVCDAFQGNFGSLAIDGTGADVYRESIQYGADTPVCADAVPGCTNYNFNTETGNIVGATKQGIDYVYANTPTNCDTWAEVVTGSGTTEKITPECNPWRPGYEGLSTRLWIIPIVDGLWDSGGTNPIVIKSFAIVFLEDNTKCTGSGCDLKARFIESTVNLQAWARTQLYTGAKATSVVLVK